MALPCLFLFRQLGIVPVVLVLYLSLVYNQAFDKFIPATSYLDAAPVKSDNYPNLFRTLPRELYKHKLPKPSAPLPSFLKGGSWVKTGFCVFESHNQAFRPKVQCKYWFRAYLLN
jgi:hypothetical protein